jgi:toxin ParE1/3/4
MAEYRLAPAAERDLETIWTYTYHQWGINQANRYLDRLAKAFSDLAHAPMAAPSCDHIRRGYRYRHIERHVVYFRITDYGIAVVRILHERMNPPNHL